MSTLFLPPKAHMRVSLTVIFCLLMCFTSPNIGYALTVDTIIMMHKGGVPASALITTIQSAGETFSLTLEDIKKLKAAGVSQEVIHAMQPDRVEPEPEPEPEPELEPKPEPKLDSETQRRVEEAIAKEKLRIQAALMATFSVYEKAFKEGRYAEALKGYDDFLKRRARAREEFILASFGMAEALFKMKLYTNARVKYQEILEIPPDENPVFEQAFNRFRQCVQIIGFDDYPGSLSEHYIGGFSQTFQNSYFYFIGKSLFKTQEFEEARLNLEKVSNQSVDYARAQYVLGLIAVIESSSIEQRDGKEIDVYDFKGLIKATKYFQEATTFAEHEEYREELRRVIDLSYLSLARIAYKLGDEVPGSYDVALFYYRKVSQDSELFFEAQHESAWAYHFRTLELGLVNKTYQHFKSLEAPRWDHSYLPDLHLLKGVLFKNLCLIEEAQLELEALHHDYFDHIELIIRVYENLGSDHKSLFSLLQDQESAFMTKVRDGLSRGPFFKSINLATNHILNEIDSIKKHQDILGEELAARLLERLLYYKDEHLMSINQYTIEFLRNKYDELSKIKEQALELKIDLNMILLTGACD